MLFNRRKMLQFGTASMMLDAVASHALCVDSDESRNVPGFGKAKSVVVVYASGGQSHIDMWDPKPMAPDHIRGIFNPISTKVPGMQFTDLLPGMAAVADRIKLVRSMSHDDLDHGSATYLSLTGRYHQRISSNPPPHPSDMPTLGSILTRLNNEPRFVHDAIHINGPALVPFYAGPGQFGGLLGGAHDPFLIGDVTEGDTAIPGYDDSVELVPMRLQERLALKDTLDRQNSGLFANANSKRNARNYAKAMELLASKNVREAFDLSTEQESTRLSYGMNRSGQACLLARRMVEAGVPYINVIFNHSNRGQDREPQDTDWYGWDTHNDIFYALKEQLVPRFDKAVPALLLDLEQRGLLDQTLVVCMGEFGRAPLIAIEENFEGTNPGRKHWARAYSVFFAGAGVKGGGVVGSTDRTGGDVVSQRYGPWDIAAPVFNALGIDPHGHYLDPLARPFEISVGNPIRDLYS